MNYRKMIKRKARISVKEHYGIWVVLCLVLMIISGGRLVDYSIARTEVTARLNLPFKGKDPVSEEIYEEDPGMGSQFIAILKNLFDGNREEGRRLADERIQKQVNSSKDNKKAVLGHSRGMLSKIVNKITSGAFIVSIAVGISSIVGSDSVAVIILILVSLVIVFLVWFLFINVYKVVMVRMFMEGMRYEKIHTQRVFYLLKVRKWVQACLTMCVMRAYKLLWWFTIVGGLIKHYSYFMVPYIVAENPEIGANETITLSRKMMNGHKWELFILDLSFLGWEILGAFTGWIVNILITRPYKETTMCEYYAMLRRIGKEKKIPGSQLLNDRYLFETPSQEMLLMAYGDVLKKRESEEDILAPMRGIHRFMIKNLGIVFFGDKKEREFEKKQAEMLQGTELREAYEGKIYPARLGPLSVKNKNTRQWLSQINYMRCYSVWSVIMVFFIMSFGGWIWEVSLHLITNGTIVNRGVLHGPWLPIYGSGSILILLLLYRFRNNPAIEFVMTMVVCGGIEYLTSYVLELINGKRWWDYSGYFLNLNGRICAEGLLVFGVGGLVIIDVLAPLLDNLVQRMNHKLLVVLCVSLICVFLTDQGYSSRYPNSGKGVTTVTKIRK